MAVEHVPEGYTTVTPWVISQDTAGVIDYLKAAFGAEELGRVVDARGRIGHAEVRIGDAVVMLFDGQRTSSDIDVGCCRRHSGRTPRLEVGRLMSLPVGVHCHANVRHHGSRIDACSLSSIVGIPVLT